ncbi:MAG: IS1249 family transposase [Eggerthellaceae bacterium]|nr:IS1249 family transposase [Eggerthellaceae bacterium]
MNNPRCASCGAEMKRNGTTSAGTPRWRCKSCGASSVRRIDNSAKTLEAFLAWLLSKDAIADLKMSRATFWRRFGWVWRIWPVAPFAGEVHDVVFLDGLHLGRVAVVLIAVAGGHVVAWHLARMPAPAMAVCDGSPGFAKAARAIWPGTRIQRCTFHAANQVRRYTTLNPRLEAGRELLGIANRLGAAKDADSATEWLLEYNAWCAKWTDFLKEHTVKDGKRVYTHERLRRARRSLNRLVKDGALFTFVEMQQELGGEWPSTNNAVESVNSRIRDMLYLHRGLPLMHRIKAIFWWCYMHTEDPLPAAEILRVMPTDDKVDGLFAAASSRSGRDDGAPDEYGNGIVWGEFHMPTEYRQ